MFCSFHAHVLRPADICLHSSSLSLSDWDHFGFEVCLLVQRCRSYSKSGYQTNNCFVRMIIFFYYCFSFGWRKKKTKKKTDSTSSTSLALLFYVWTFFSSLLFISFFVFFFIWFYVMCKFNIALHTTTGCMNLSSLCIWFFFSFSSFFPFKHLYFIFISLNDYKRMLGMFVYEIYKHIQHERQCERFSFSLDVRLITITVLTIYFHMEYRRGNSKVRILFLVLALAKKIGR